MRTSVLFKALLLATGFLMQSGMNADAQISGVYGYGASATGKRTSTPQVISVYSASSLTPYLERRDGADNKIFKIYGRINLGGKRFFIPSNSTVVGATWDAGFTGHLLVHDNFTNVIIRDLFIYSPGNDGVTVGGNRVIIYKCSFQDCNDGAIDIAYGGTNVSVAYCHFKYVNNLQSLVCLVNGANASTLAKATFHHNWFGANCFQRMVKAHDAFVHMFSNYYNSSEMSYAIGVATGGYVVGSNQVYENASNPWNYNDGANVGGIRLWNTLLTGTTKWPWGNYSNRAWDTLPYSVNYSFAATDRYSVKSVVTGSAGVNN